MSSSTPYRRGKGCLLALLPAVAAVASAQFTMAAEVKNTNRLPMAFTASADPQSTIRFSARGRRHAIELTTDTALVMLDKATLPIRVVGAAPRTSPVAEDQLPGKENFLIGNDPKKWRRSVDTFAKVAYRGVLPGINLFYYGNEKRLEYDFEVTPGANPKSIRMEIGSQWKASVAKNGDLNLKTRDSAVSLTFARPVTYQLAANGNRVAVESSYLLETGNRFGFQVGKYDRSKTLVIDPVVVYGTYLGGGVADTGNSVAVDAAGNAYVTGTTFSPTFPTTAGSFMPHCLNTGFFNYVCGSPNIGQIGYAFVTKFNPQGTQVIYSTYLGGDLEGGSGASSDGTYGNAIAVDANGNAYVTGSTESFAYPVSANAAQSRRTPLLQTTWPGACAPPSLRYNNLNPDAFVTKLDPTGANLLYSSYLGSSQNDYANSIAVNSSGEMYIVGQTNGSDRNSLNYTGCSFDAGKFSDFGLIGATGPSDQNIGVSRGFLIKLSASGAILHSQYIGIYTGPGDTPYITPTTYASGVAIDGAGAAYIVGGSQDPRFGNGCAGCVNLTQASGVQVDFLDAFILKLNPDFSQSYLLVFGGAGGNDYARGVAIDGAGNAYVAGNSEFQRYPSQTLGNFPTTAGAYLTTRPALAQCGFLTKIAPAGSIAFSTLLCNPDAPNGKNMSANSVAVDSPTSTAVVTGNASSTLPLVNAVSINASGGTGVYVTRFNSAGSNLLFSSFLAPGGFQNDNNSEGWGIALDSQLNAYITGQTSGTNGAGTGSLSTPGAFSLTNSGSTDAFLLKVNIAQASDCQADASGSTTVTRGGLRYNNATQSFVQIVSVTNNIGSPATNAVLALDGLSSNATLPAANGKTSCAAPTNSPFVNLGTIGGGQTVSVTLQFADPTKAAITYNTRVLAGSGIR